MKIHDKISEEDALIAEYVLLLLSPDEHREFLSRLEENEDLQDVVMEWQVVLHALAGLIGTVDPPAELKISIMKNVASLKQENKR